MGKEEAVGLLWIIGVVVVCFSTAGLLDYMTEKSHEFKVGTCVQYKSERDPWEIEPWIHKIELIGDYTYLVCEKQEDCVYLESLLANHNIDKKDLWLWDTIRKNDWQKYSVVPCARMER